MIEEQKTACLKGGATRCPHIPSLPAFKTI